MKYLNIRLSWRNFFIAGSIAGTSILVLVVTLICTIGIQIKEVPTPIGNFSNIIIRWQKGLELSVDKATLTINRQSSDICSFRFTEHLTNTLKYLPYFTTISSSVNIKSITSDFYNGNFNYSYSFSHKEGSITATSKELLLSSTLTTHAKKLVLNIKHFELFKNKSSAQGRFTIDSVKKTVSGEFIVDLAESLSLDLFLFADGSGLSFSGIGRNPTTNIKPVIDLFAIDPEIVPWITEYSHGSSYTLESIGGTFPWKKPEQLLTSLYGRARIEELQYTFADGFEPAFSKHTDVTFTKGVLEIIPTGATFYGQDGQKSWVKIDFNNYVEPILSVHIKTTATLNDDILRLLKYYEIPLPFKQLQGTTKADLTLWVNLSKLTVDAIGTFSINKSSIEYLGKTWDVTKGKVEINNSDIQISDVHLSLEKFLSAHLSGNLNPTKESGTLTFNIQHFFHQVEEKKFKLNTENKPVVFKYNISETGDTIHLNSTEWTFGSTELYFKPLTTTFNSLSFRVPIPNTPFLLKMAELEVQGNLLGFIGLQEEAAEFNLEINKLSYETFTLAQPGWKMHAALKEDVRVITENTGIFSIDGIKTIISPFQAYIDNKSISLTSGEFSLDTFLHSKVEGKIDRDSGQGSMKLFDVSLQFDSLGSLFFHEEEITTNIFLTESNLSFIFPNYQTTLNFFNDKTWNVFCDAVHLLTPFSALLQKFNITEGHFLFGSKNGGSPFVFDGTLISPYQFLVENGVKSGVFSIKGEIDNNIFSGIINEKTHISLSDIIQIHSKETGFNLPELIKQINHLRSTPEKQQKKILRLHLIAEKSAIYFSKKNKAPADTLYFEYHDDTGVLQIEHDTGSAWLYIQGNNIEFSGKNFNDTFFERLLRDSSFNEGYMGFYGSGQLNDFSVLFQISDTNLIDYGMINNIFAFVDTIPALITFSLPDYTLSGMDVSSATAFVNYRDKDLTINSLQIDSETLDMYGAGTANLEEGKVDMKINLITTAKKNISKIPLVGYVLVGERQHPSITLKVTGDIENPIVTSSAFVDYIVWPMETAFRILTLPYEIIKDFFTKGLNHPLKMSAPSLEKNSSNTE